MSGGSRFENLLHMVHTPKGTTSSDGRTCIMDKDGVPLNNLVKHPQTQVHYPIFASTGDEALARILLLKTLATREDDVFLVSFPKTGCHWVFEMIYMLVTQSSALYEGSKLQTFMELVGVEWLDKCASPRVINTHVWPDDLPGEIIDKGRKVVLLCRNPKDAVVSFYHYVKSIGIYRYAGTWDAYFQLTMEGKAPYGEFCSYHNAWEGYIKNNTKLNIHIMYYEDLKVQPVNCIKKLAAFLGKPCDDKFAAEIATSTSFQNMKALRVGQATKSGLGKEGEETAGAAFRKGKIGDWKTHFTVSQNEMYDRHLAKELGHSMFKFTY